MYSIVIVASQEVTFLKHKLVTILTSVEGTFLNLTLVIILPSKLTVTSFTFMDTHKDNSFEQVILKEAHSFDQDLHNLYSSDKAIHPKYTLLKVDIAHSIVPKDELVLTYLK